VLAVREETFRLDKARPVVVGADTQSSLLRTYRRFPLPKPSHAGLVESHKTLVALLRSVLLLQQAVGKLEVLVIPVGLASALRET
jgi:hypothetical protein